MSVVSYEVFVLSLFVPHLSFFWCLGEVVFRDLAFSGYLHLYVSFRERKYGLPDGLLQDCNNYSLYFLFKRCIEYITYVEPYQAYLFVVLALKSKDPYSSKTEILL